MGYFFNNISQLANYFVDQSDSPGNTAEASVHSTSNPVDFESLLKAISGGLDPATLSGFNSGDSLKPAVEAETGSILRSLFNGDIAESPTRPFDSLANADFEGGESAPLPGVDNRFEIKSSEPISINTGMVRILLAENNETLIIEIPSGDAEQLLGTGDNRKPTDILNESAIARNTSVYMPPTDFSGDQGHSEKVLISFKAAELIRNMEIDSFTKIGITQAGSAARSEYVDISSLVKLIRNYPDPVKIELPLLKDSGDNIPDGIVPREQSTKAAFVFDLRQILKTEKVVENEKTNGVMVFSGKTSQSVKPAIPDTIEKRDSILTPRYPNSQISYEKQNFIDKQTSTVRNAVDILNSLSTPRGSTGSIPPGTAGMTFSSAEHEPVKYVRADSGKRAVESADIKPAAIEQASDVSKTAFSIRGATMVNNTGNMTTEILNAPMNRSLDIDEIRSAVILAAKRNQSTIRIRLKPAELGNLDIKLTVKQGILSAELKVANIEAFRILNGRLDDLKTGLENFNLKVNEINVIHDLGLNSDHDGYEFNDRDAEMWSGRNRNNAKQSDLESLINDDDAKTGRESSSETNIHKGWIDLKA